MPEYPRKYVALLERLDAVWRAAETLRQELQEMPATKPEDAKQLGKAIALMSVVESAAKDAAHTIGRTSRDF